MNRKEREQLIVFKKLKDREISQREAALKLTVSGRWVRKKFKRYLQEGDRGLVHKSRGQVSKKRWCEKERGLMIGLLQSEWQGFGPTFTAEKLKEVKNIKTNKETVRQEMIKSGVWQGKQRKLKHRKRRERRQLRGLLVQLDGSPHDWFEGRAEWCTLLVFIDDATSELLWLEFVPSEANIPVMQATKNYITRHGKPHEFYVDFGKVFSVNLNNKERERKTQWERAMKELDIKVIHAHSPQAKGRVERANGTLQDRLVKELRLAGVSSIKDANKYLQERDFMAWHNKLFAVVPTQIGDAHRPIVTDNLDHIFCLRDQRILANDYTITYKKRIFQLTGHQKAMIRPKDKIAVNTYLDMSIRLYIRKHDLIFEEIKERPLHSSQLKSQEDIIKKQIPNKPSENSRRWVAGKRFLPSRFTRRG